MRLHLLGAPAFVLQQPVRKLGRVADPHTARAERAIAAAELAAVGRVVQIDVIGVGQREAHAAQRCIGAGGLAEVIGIVDRIHLGPIDAHHVHDAVATQSLQIHL